MFVEFEHNSSAWSIELGDGWEQVGNSNVYAYRSSNAMTELTYGDSVTFTAAMTVKAEGSTYKELVQNDGFRVELTGHAINTEVSQTNVENAWDDYEKSENPGMVEALERN